MWDKESCWFLACLMLSYPGAADYRIREEICLPHFYKAHADARYWDRCERGFRRWMQG